MSGKERKKKAQPGSHACDDDATKKKKKRRGGIRKESQHKKKKRYFILTPTLSFFLPFQKKEGFLEGVGKKKQDQKNWTGIGGSHTAKKKKKKRKEVGMHSSGLNHTVRDVRCEWTFTIAASKNFQYRGQTPLMQ